MSRHNPLSRVILLAFMLLAVVPGTASARTDADEDFVIASLLLSEPGGALYSRMGHAALRMQCPDHGLDYVFSYFTEDIIDYPFRFLSGHLKTGLLAVPTQDYLDDYGRQGRGVTEYMLNIPLEDKRNLWRILDEHIVRGICEDYDYLRLGCAHGTLMLLREGLGDDSIVFGGWPDHFSGASRREITYYRIGQFKWTTFILHFICNGVIDDLECSNLQKVIMPADLPFVLEHATLAGVPLITEEPQEVLPDTWQPEKVWLTPLLLAFILLLLTFVSGLLRKSYMTYVLLGIQTLLGLLNVWLLCFSDLVCTEWSWLIVPFNPLPLLLWKWRKYWSLPYAAILLIWSAVMFFRPHLMTDPAYIVMALAIAISCIFVKLDTNSLRYE